jgi:YD repeat-containing protein
MYYGGGIQPIIGGRAYPNNITNTTCDGQPDNVFSGFVFIDSNKTSHSFPDIHVDQYGCLTTSQTETAIDGSGFTLQAVASPSQPESTTETIWDAAGNNSTSTNTRFYTVYDTDGASSSYNFATGAIADTLGTSTPFLTASFGQGGAGSGADTYTWADAKGNSQQVTVGWQQMTIRTNFQCTGLTDIAPITEYLVTSILLPTGAQYTISYEPTYGYSGDYTGRINEITLPTGGYVQYSYTGGSHGFVCGGSSAPVITRFEGDNNGHVSKWVYSNAGGIGGSNGSVVETDPAGNTITHYFSQEYETGKTVQDANNHVLSTSVTCYNKNYSSKSACIAPSHITAPITQIDVYTYPNGSTSPSLVETQFDSYQNAFDIKNYDYGAAYPPSGSTTPLSETVTVYSSGSNCGTTSSSIHIDPCSVITYSGGTQTQKTLYTYNNAGGHPTETDKWISGATYLKSYATYNSNGTIASSTDWNTAVTSYYYNGTGQCNGVLLTSTVFPIDSLTTSQSWHCDGGAVNTATDENSQVTTNTYYNPSTGVADPFWRVNQVSAPYNGTNSVTNFSYSATSQESSLVFNSNSSTADVLTTSDGLSRTISTQSMTGPASGYDQLVQYGYTWDSTGLLMTKLLPGGTNPTKTQLDAAGRTTTITDGGLGVTTYTYSSNDILIAGPSSSRQIEYDGIGRMKSVCEVSSQTGSMSCGQNSPAIGFLTTYLYGANSVTATQNKLGTSQQRSYSYDGIGRLTQENNPETGTTYYTYDNDTTCGTSTGDLVKRIDAVGNVTCYAYDAIHRNTGITYPSGSYAAKTPSKYFVYDSTTFTCSTGANVKGRLAEAYTGSSGSKTTDLGYCYSPRGELTDAYESTPDSNGYYHTTASYWTNGALETLAGVPYHTAGWTFGVDGEGRPYSAVDQTVPQNLVTSATYYPTTLSPTVDLPPESVHGIIRQVS